jgi:hypothetical protein
VLHQDGRSRRPHLRTWRDGWRHLKFLLAFSPRWLFLYPALALLGLGAVGLGVLAFGPRALGGVHFATQTMLACATAVIAGIQTVGLWVIAHSYATHLELLPKSGRLDRWLGRLTLERGLVMGLVLFVAGIVCFGIAFFYWGSLGFRNLNLPSTIRLPIFAMVLVIAGLQITMVSFVTSLTEIESV